MTTYNNHPPASLSSQTGHVLTTYEVIEYPPLLRTGLSNFLDIYDDKVHNYYLDNRHVNHEYLCNDVPTYYYYVHWFFVLFQLSCEGIGNHVYNKRDYVFIWK